MTGSPGRWAAGQRRKIDSLAGLEVEVLTMDGVSLADPIQGTLVEISDVGIMIRDTDERIIFSSSITFRVLEDRPEKS